MTSIIILTFNKLEYTKLCIDSIRKFTARDKYEIIVVDNNSTDDTVKWLKGQKDIKCIYNEKNLGFPKGCNQGIEIAEGDNILLLNNDVIVTHNWLDNLIKCLYSDETIGSVGAVTNSCSYYQVISAEYTDIDGLYKFAEKHNISDSKLWEERLKLVGFCMLIKKEVVDKIGLLDEVFTPGNFEDDDYSIRIRKAGYRLILCKDTYIYHFGSTSFKDKAGQYNALIMKNKQKFEEKWSCDTYHLIDIRQDLAELIDESFEAAIKVLQIECGGGGTLLYIKHLFPNSKLYGTELHSSVLVNYKHFAEIYSNNILDNEISLSEESYDYIIMSDLPVEYKGKELDLVNKTLGSLTENGKIILSMTSENEINFDMQDINILCGGKCVIEESESRGNRVFIINKISGNSLLYLIKEIDDNQESGDRTYYLIGNFIKNESELTEVMEKVKRYNFSNKTDILNTLAVRCFEIGKNEFVIPLLQEALTYDSRDRDTLANLSIILEQYGEYELALRYINMIENRDKDICELADRILKKQSCS